MGINERTMTAPTTQWIFFSISGIASPKKKPSKTILKTQPIPPNMLQARNFA